MEPKTTAVTPEQWRAQEDCCARLRAYWQERGTVPAAYVETYGCQQNEADSERIAGMLERCGYILQEEAEGADAVVVNTCAVREHAEQRVFGNVGAMVHGKRRHPGQKIFLCGCMMGQPHVARKIQDSYRHVDGVFSTHHLWRFPELLWETVTTGKRVFATEDAAGSIAEGLPVRRAPGPRAWVSVMYGCNNFCSYCIVPYVRGRERSRKPEAVIDEVRALAEQGYRDITLLGQNVNSYGKDLGGGIDFSGLLEELAAIPGDFWLHFLTSHPKDASARLFDTMGRHERLAGQLHLPFQSGSDRVLQAMNRRYTAAEYLALVEYARAAKPGLVLTADVIVTDWSSVFCEFCFTTLRPAVFIDTPPKVRNPNWRDFGLDSTDINLRNRLGKSLALNELDQFADAIADMLAHKEAWHDRIRDIRDGFVFNLGHGGEAAGEYLLKAVLEKQQAKEGERSHA